MNVVSDEDGAQILEALGVKALPAVVKGESVVVGFDLAEVERLVGWSSDGAGTPLPGEALVARSRRLLDSAARYACQLPPSHYDDVIPGMEDTDGPFRLPDGRSLRFPDGKPFVPHRTSLGLVRHILAHGVKFLVMVQARDLDDLSDLATFGLLGEPPESVTVSWLVDEMTRVVDDIQRCWQEPVLRPDLDRMVDTFAGPKPLYDMLEAMTYSLAQHTRQLMTILVGLGIDPDGPLTEADYQGLGLPARVWD